MSTLVRMLGFTLVFTIVFSVFVEVYVGSISIRVNSDNQPTFQLQGLLHFLSHPLHNSFLWNPELWIVNYPLMLSFFLLINLIYSKYDQSHTYGPTQRTTPNSTRIDSSQDFYNNLSQ